MPVYDWRRRPIRHFGESWVPLAEIALRSSDQKYQTFAVQVDSGAVVSLLRRSVADLLGLDFESGREIELESVGGKKLGAYVHDIRCRFGPNIEITAPFAVASSEEVPNLIGRRGIFDELQVDFDPCVRQTRISAPWLKENDIRIRQFLLDTERHILNRWKNNPLPKPGDEVASRFVRRGAQLVAAIEALAKLHRAYEAPLLIRSMLELSVQFEYLLRDTKVRAQSYLDFEHVTKYRQAKAITSQPSGFIAKSLSASPLRAEGEPRLKREYDRVVKQFTSITTKKHSTKSRVWSTWYGRSFVELSKEMGHDAEYHLWYRLCSGWAHADPFQIRRTSVLDDHGALVMAQCYYARILLSVAEAKKIILDAEQYEFLTKAAKGVI